VDSHFTKFRCIANLINCVGGVTLGNQQVVKHGPLYRHINTIGAQNAFQRVNNFKRVGAIHIPNSNPIAANYVRLCFLRLTHTLALYP